MVPLDAVRIRQALVNLIGNAIKFTPNGGRVRIYAAPSGSIEGVRIEIEDTGPGIPAEEHERIFVEFHQAPVAHGGGRPEGAGLGLTLAKRFVEMHGGRLWVESEVGQGSRFILTLPWGSQQAPPDNGSVQLAHEVGDRLHQGDGRRILLVEDNPVSRRQVAFLLTAHGYDVCAVEGASEALAEAVERPPVLILMDMRLPGMDGLTATRYLKAHPGTRHIPVIALTANAMQEDVVNATEAGCCGFVAKPFEQSAFLEEIRKALATMQAKTSEAPISL